MRKNVLDDKFYMPKQYELGTAEKDVTEPTETPNPLAKGPDGLPKFNELQKAQKRNMPKAMRSQVAFQQKKLQYSNYQIINFRVIPTDSVASQSYYINEYNVNTEVGTALDGGVLFGTNTEDDTRAKYYNIVYINARFNTPFMVAGSNFILSPSFIEFYLMQKLGAGGDFGGKIPRQIEAVANSVLTSSITVTGTQYGVQSFGVDIYNENTYLSQSKHLKGMRCCGVALKEIFLNFDSAIAIDGIKIDVELAIDLTTEGNNY